MVKKKNKTSNKLRSIYNLIFVLALLVVINLLAQQFFTRYDLTKEKKYSLTNSTKDLLADLDDMVYIKVYLDGAFPSGFKRLRKNTFEIINEFRNYGYSNIQFEFTNPLEGLNEKQQNEVLQLLAEKNIQATNLQVKSDEGYREQIIIPAASIFYKGRETTIQFLESKAGQNPQDALNSSIALLEYKFAKAIKTLQNASPPKVGILQGNGELPKSALQSIINSMSSFYRVETYNLPDHLYISETFDVIIIAKPTERFSESEKYKIDQYLMNGGKIIWLIDKMIADLDSLRQRKGFISIERELNLDDQLFKYGVRVNNNLVQDLQANPIPIVVGNLNDVPQYDMFPWLYYPVITSDDKKHPVSKNIDAVMTEFTGTIDTIKNDIKKTVLLQTSAYTKVLYSPVRVNLGMIKEKPNRAKFQKGKQNIAVLLEGEFPSLFKGRLSKTTKAAADTIKQFTNRSKSVETKMLVIADGDLIKNEIGPNGETMPLGYYKATKNTFANTQFFLNALEYMTDNSGLIESRSKEVKLRLLDLGKIKEEQSFWQVLNIILPIILIILFGLFFNLYRRWKYSK